MLAAERGAHGGGCTVVATDYDELSIPELARRLAETTRLLVQKQVELAKQEARADLQITVRGIIFLVVGAALLLFAVVCLLIALTAATALLLASLFGGNPLWLAGIIWLVLFAAAGGICLWLGKQRIRTRPLSLTRAALQENVEWAKHRLTPPER